MESSGLKQGLAELIGTFTLVFIGAGAGIMATPSGSGLLGVALAHGFALLVIVYSWGSVSGAHVNPAVTFGLALTRKIDPGKAVVYWIAQIVGGVAAAYLLLWLVGSEGGLGQTVGTLTKTDAAKTIVIEAVLTYFLVVAVYASGVLGRNGNAAGLGIGLVLTMDILAAGPLTGASMNPARTFGPALAAGDLGYVWMYVVGPFLGGGLGAVTYHYLVMPETLKPPVEAAKKP